MPVNTVNGATNGTNGTATTTTFTNHPLYYTLNKAQHIALNSKLIQTTLSLAAPVTTKLQPYIEPHVHTVIDRAQPLVNTVDTKLSHVVTELQKSQLMANVDHIIAQRKLSADDVKAIVSTFYTTAAESFVQISHTQRQSVESYIQTVRTKLGNIWTDDLIQPLNKFYASAMTVYESQYDADGKSIKPSASELLKSIQSQLPTDYTDKVTEAFSHRVTALQSTGSTIASTVNHGWQSVLTRTQHVFDIVVPPVDKYTDSVLNGQVHTDKSIGTLRQHVKDRIKSQATHRFETAKTYTVDKAQSTYNTVKYVSSDHVQPLLHVDPVAMLEPIVINNAHLAFDTMESVRKLIDELTDMLRSWTSTQRTRANNAQTAVTGTVSGLAHSGVEKAKHVLPQHIQDQVTKLSSTLTTLNVKNLTDIQLQLSALRDLLSSNQENGVVQPNINVNSTPAKNGKFNNIKSPMAPGAAGMFDMFASPAKVGSSHKLRL